MAVRATVTGLDHSGEGTSTGVYLLDLTAANFDAQGTKLTTIQSAIQGVSKIAYDGLTYPAHVVARESAKPAATDAQREFKWLVKYRDNVNGRAGRLEIGGALTTLLTSGTDLMNIASGAGLTLKNALETDAVSRDGNALTVTEVRLTGRAF